jgi:hypothetical protein
MKVQHFLISICLSFTFFASENVVAQTPDWLWAKGMGSNNDDQASSIAIDDNGNVYTTGFFSDTVDFDPGSGTFDLISNGGEDIFLLKLDHVGNFVWAKSIGGIGFDWGFSIKINPDGDIFMTGFYSDTVDFDPGASVFNLNSSGANDCFVARFNSDGDLEWAKSMGGVQSDAGSSLAIDNSDNVYITGSFNGTADFNPDTTTYNLTANGELEIFVAKLDSAGNFVWANSFGGTEDDQGYSITVDENGNVYSTGYFEKTVDFDPDTAIVFNLTSNGNLPDAYISKLDSDGNFEWARSFNGPASNNGNSIEVDNAGFVYTTGSFLGTVDFDPDSLTTYNVTTIGAYDIYVSKLDSSGNFVWVKQMGGTDDDQAFAILLDDSSNIFTTGIYRTAADFDPDVTGVFNLSAVGAFDLFILKLDSAGNFGWAVGAGGNSRDNGSALAFDNYENLFMAGYYYSDSISFGSTTLNGTNPGITGDILITRFGNITTGIYPPSIRKNQISVFPNPADKLVTLSFDTYMKDATIRLFDSNGKIVLVNSHVSGDNVAVNIEKLSQGNYIISIEEEGMIYRSRISKY